ncbi:tetratricopeptide repeat protein [Billgrantia tianxiuensis]|jgi:putative thioredoxin|uniref:Tetratricopeptide repeat protein n=1 Tax=Billgrantia tianxiuensis TaxID=2497861 RepID=A0A6I6SE29_9GAMM|nr:MULTISPECIES: tetratricopeptide repeat protein [Halomonas]MCE8032917.1 tetratricopeptide repeat protein [Halomonas sp. MCCC 1A11057]QHC48719.1 tetratricopeptide repeat protein [Halomonas tianxiuensis]
MSIVDPRSGAPLTAPQEPSSPSRDTAPSDEQLIVDVDHNNIQQLLELSMQVPVLLDCWAPWCQPCKALMPILEKLTREYRGAFILAKLNIEDNQEIAAQLGVRSVPDVKLISQGGLVDHFQGALPEKEVREWLGRYFPAPEDAPASPEEQAAEALAQGDAATARALYEQLVQQNPDHAPYQVELARALVAESRSEEALALLDNLPPEERDAAPARGVRASIEFREEAPGDDELAALAGRDDSEARYKRALRQVADGDYESGLEGLLEVMRRDRGYGDDVARKTLLRVFDALGADHPLTVTYRRRLFTLLY